MTAPVRNRPFSPQEWPVSGDHITSRVPGSLWERVEESGANLLTVNGWLCINTGQHNCGGGFAAVGYAHEPGCGLEPLYHYDKLAVPSSTGGTE